MEKKNRKRKREKMNELREKRRKKEMFFFSAHMFPFQTTTSR